jgi:hypothetical protein
MVVVLQRIRLLGQEFFIDERLQEVRNVEKPWESIPIKEICDYPEEYNLKPEWDKKDKQVYDFLLGLIRWEG